MPTPRPSLGGLIRLLAVAMVVAFSLSAVSMAYAAGRHSATAGWTDATPLDTMACAPSC